MESPTQNELAFFNRAKAYTQMKESGALKYLISFLNDRIDAQLDEMVEKKDADATLTARLVDRWRERQMLADELLNEVESTIASFRTWAQENLSEQQKEKIRILENINVDDAATDTETV